MWRKGAVELAPLPSPGFYSQLFVVIKASRLWKPVIDLSTLNLRVLKSPFRMETLQSVLLSVLDGISGSKGGILASSNPSGQPQVSQVHSLWIRLSVQGSAFWSLHGS